jgi:hypothetical protein
MLTSSPRIETLGGYGEETPLVRVQRIDGGLLLVIEESEYIDVGGTRLMSVRRYPGRVERMFRDVTRRCKTSGSANENQ